MKRSSRALAGRALFAALCGAVALPAAASPQAPAPEAATLEDLAWMAGHWRGESERLGGTAEEGWLAPSGGSMAGVFRLVSNGRARVFELVLIEQEEEGIFLRFKHVGPGWKAWEENALEYRLTELEGERAAFESTADAPTPRTPRQVVYRKDGPDTLVAHLVGWTEGDPGFELRMERVP